MDLVPNWGAGSLLILCTASDGSRRKNVVSFHLEAHPARFQVGQFFVMSPVELVEWYLPVNQYIYIYIFICRCGKPIMCRTCSYGNHWFSTSMSHNGYQLTLATDWAKAWRGRSPPRPELMWWFGAIKVESMRVSNLGTSKCVITIMHSCIVT